MRAQFSGPHHPTAVAGPPIIRAATRIDDVEVKDTDGGDDASKLRSMLECKYPMENRMVRSWEDMQHVWDLHIWT